MKTKSGSQGFTHIYLIIAVLVLAAIGLVGWRVVANQNQSKTQAVASEVKPDSQALKGLKEAGASPKGSDIIVSNIDGGSQPFNAADSDAAPAGSVSLNIQDHRGWTYDNLNNFMVRTPDGQTYEPLTLLAQTKGVNISSCSIVDSYTPDDTSLPTQTVKLKAVSSQSYNAYDGDHMIKATCGDNSYILAMRVADNQPKKCKNFQFTPGSITAQSLSDLKSGMVGTWVGCVTTPWVPVYYVTITFRADGTYSGNSDEVLDGAAMNAFYYGTQQDNPGKKYVISNFSNDKIGSGDLVIVFDVGTTTSDSLSNVKLMGDKLSFDFTHFGHGPLTYQLTRK